MSEFPALAAGYKIYGALCVTETGFGPFSHWKTKKFIITKNYVFLMFNFIKQNFAMKMPDCMTKMHKLATIL